ncbi:DrmE family protein [Desulfitobacterium sp.]|uniref:DrmE family protein n=1 Tax=Desulfitobacterium sp. TaxID=49981 RepID=UPI002C90690E|nr:DrmE family protein [Desulfitobacterium sp.]HVJ48463.1 DrmE family protein [Desulfitobacterium sp.]
MERYLNAENLTQAIIQSKFEYASKCFTHTKFNEQNYNILSEILIGESSRNLIVHPGSNALLVECVIAAVFACYTQDVLLNQTSLLDSLKDDAKILYERNRGIYKGLTEINGELKIHMVFNGLSRYVPLSNGYKISPYLGNAKTLSKGINKKSKTSRSEALGQVFGVSPDSIKNVTESSILVLCQKSEADAIAESLQLVCNLCGSVKLKDLFPMAYYSSCDSIHSYSGNSAKLEPVIKFTSRISTARDLIYDDEEHSIRTVIINGYDLIGASPSELSDIMNCSFIHDVIMLAGYAYGSIDECLSLFPQTRVFAWSEEALISKVADLFSPPDLSNASDCISIQYKMIGNQIDKQTDQAMVCSPFPDDMPIKCRKLLQIIKNNTEDCDDKDYFISRSYSLLNLFERACFPIRTLERLVENGKVTGIMPLEEIGHLRSVGESLLTKNSVISLENDILNVIDTLLSLRKYLYSDNPKYAWLKNRLFEVSWYKHQNYAIVVPKQYFIDAFTESLTPGEKSVLKDCKFYTPTRFDNVKLYDGVICCGVFEGKRFNAFTNTNSTVTEVICYPSETGLFRLMERNNIKRIEAIDRLNAIKFEHEINNNFTLINQDISDESVGIIDLEKFITAATIRSGVGSYPLNDSSTCQRVETVRTALFETGERAMFTKGYKPYVFDRLKNEVIEVDVSALDAGDEIVFTQNDDDSKDIVNKIINQMHTDYRFEQKYGEYFRKATYWKTTLSTFMKSNALSYREVSQRMHRIGKDKHEVTIRSWLDEDSRIVGPRDSDSYQTIAVLTNDNEMLSDPSAFCRACEEVRSLRVRALKHLEKCIMQAVGAKSNGKVDDLIASVMGDVSQIALILQIDTIVDHVTIVPVNISNKPLSE